MKVKPSLQKNKSGTILTHSWGEGEGYKGGYTFFKSISPKVNWSLNSLTSTLQSSTP